MASPRVDLDDTGGLVDYLYLYLHGSRDIHDTGTTGLVLRNDQQPTEISLISLRGPALDRGRLDSVSTRPCGRETGIALRGAPHQM